MLLYLVSLLKVGPHSGGGWDQRWGFLPHMAVPRHPPMGPFCFVFWADRGPGASCPYGEGPRRALVTFPRWKVTRGEWAAPAGAFRGQPPQAALGPRWRSAPKLPTGTLRCKPPQAALGPKRSCAPPCPGPKQKAPPRGVLFFCSLPGIPPRPLSLYSPIKPGVDRYRSPESGSRATMVLPAFSGRLASSTAAWMAAPEVMPTKMPSLRAASRQAA